MKTNLLIYFIIFFITIQTMQAQLNQNNVPLTMKRETQRTNLNIPDIDSFYTLKGDFHTHTVFSDGLVWPTVRVQEAWEQGLDVLAITDHIEYLPYKKYIKKDHNQSYEIAKNDAAKKNILLVKASEITRNMPPGHLNALFIDDANELEQENWEDSFKAVEKQKALMIWNHPGWKAQQPDTTMLFDIHRQLIAEKKICGMEVFNYNEWYPVVLQWCLDNNLAVFANSDMHNSLSYIYDLDKTHRPMTLLFTKERTLKGVREAIEAARTIAWFGNQLAGPGNLMEKLFKASVKIGKLFYSSANKNDEIIHFELTNYSDFHFDFINETPENGAPAQFSLQPRKTIILWMNKNSANFKCKITNCHTGLNKNLITELFHQ